MRTLMMPEETTSLKTTAMLTFVHDLLLCRGVTFISHKVEKARPLLHFCKCPIRVNKMKCKRNQYMWKCVCLAWEETIRYFLTSFLLCPLHTQTQVASKGKA